MAKFLTASSAPSLAGGFRSSQQNIVGDASKICSSEGEPSTLLARFNGVGPWTRQMVLIFAAGRTDDMPLGDIGLRRAAGLHDAGTRFAIGAGVRKSRRTAAPGQR